MFPDLANTPADPPNLPLLLNEASVAKHSVATFLSDRAPLSVQRTKIQPMQPFPGQQSVSESSTCWMSATYQSELHQKDDNLNSPTLTMLTLNNFCIQGSCAFRSYSKQCLLGSKSEFNVAYSHVSMCRSAAFTPNEFSFPMGVTLKTVCLRTAIVLPNAICIITLRANTT